MSETVSIVPRDEGAAETALLIEMVDTINDCLNLS